MAVFTEQQAVIASIIVQHLGCQAYEVTPSVTFVDLGADSLDMVELTMALEEQFGVEIPDDEAHKVKTVQHAFTLIAEKTNG